MNQYVAITKMYKDIRTKENAAFPDEWPAECEEFGTFEDAAAKYPNAPVMSIQEYRHFSAVLSLVNNFKPLPKPAAPWWKFWA